MGECLDRPAVLLKARNCKNPTVSLGSCWTDPARFDQTRVFFLEILNNFAIPWAEMDTTSKTTCSRAWWLFYCCVSFNKRVG